MWVQTTEVRGGHSRAALEHGDGLYYSRGSSRSLQVTDVRFYGGGNIGQRSGTAIVHCLQRAELYRVTKWGTRAMAFHVRDLVGVHTCFLKRGHDYELL
jgi:hypothetical protein